MQPFYDEARSTSAYTRRLPSPPRFDIPPVGTDLELRRQLHGSTQTGFLPAFDALPRSSEQWEHSDRQRAQLVAPSIWLGPANVAKNTDMLNAMHVSRVLMIRRTTKDFASKVTPAAVRVARQAGIPTELVDVESYQQLAGKFASASALLDASVREIGAGSVLVCCENGNDVSAAVVVAYVMTRYRVEMVVASQLVQYRRFCVAINDELHRMLDAYQTILVARRDTVSEQVPSGVLQVRAAFEDGGNVSRLDQTREHSKRTLARDEDDEDMDGDKGRFEGRDYMPFV